MNKVLLKIYEALVSIKTAISSVSPVELVFTGGVTPEGAYVAGTTYTTGDSVSYLGSSYVAIQETTGNLPTDTTYWQILAEKGDDGEVSDTMYSAGFDSFLNIKSDSGYKTGIKLSERSTGVYGFVIYHDSAFNKLKIAYLDGVGDFSYEFVTIDRSSGFVGFGTVNPTALVDVNDDIIRLRDSKTPASASATGNAGDICWDSSYIYVCIATDTWKRTAIATW